MKAHKLALVPLFAVASGLCIADGVVGKWNGKMVMSDATLAILKKSPKTYAEVQNALKTVKISLNLKANKTFMVSYTGMPGSGPSAHTAEGTWVQKGDVLTVYTKKEDGKPKPDKGQKMTVSKDGKTITFIMPGNKNDDRFVFTKA